MFFKTPSRIVASHADRKSSPMIEIRGSEIKYKNKDNDIYFYVNRGGTKAVDIKYLRASFIDLDAGRDSKGKYLAVDKVRKKKQEMLKKINSFPHKPSKIVETRNGYQLYWIYSKEIPNNKTNLDKWNTVQKRLLTFFSPFADKYAVRVNQVMRVPGTFWLKRYEKLGSSLCVVVKSGSIRYTFDSLYKKTSNIHIKPVEVSWGKYTYKRINHQVCDYKVTTKLKRTPVQELGRSQKTMSDYDIVFDELYDFLTEVSTVLYYAKKPFMSKTATRLAEEIKSKYFKD